MLNYKILISILIIFVFGKIGFAQTLVWGEVTFNSSKHVYVHFNQPNTISPGDTLYLNSNDTVVPVLIAKETSSTSAACEKISLLELDVKTKVFAKITITATEQLEEKPRLEIIDPQIDSSKIEGPIGLAKLKSTSLKPSTKIKITASSLVGIPSVSQDFSYRMKYVFSIKSNSISSKPLNFESTLSFNHGNKNLEEIKKDFKNGLRIYSLNASYNFSSNLMVALGRRTNLNITNIGAVDGLQGEYIKGKMKYGIVIGSRPDYTNYWINPRYFIAGAYFNLSKGQNTKTHSTTIGIFELRNKTAVDRRFVYAQHSNNLLGKLNFFTSFESDLYKVKDSIAYNTFKISSLYIRLRYDPFKKLSISGTYDLRNNIIYYETYKNYIETLLQQNANQGLAISIFSKLFKNISISAGANYRFTNGDTLPSYNCNIGINLNKTPIKNQKIRVNSYFLETAFLKGLINGIAVDHYFENTKLNFTASYSYFMAWHPLGEVNMNQNLINFDFQKSFKNQIWLSLNADIIIEKQLINTRLYLSVSKRL